MSYDEGGAGRGIRTFAQIGPDHAGRGVKVCVQVFSLFSTYNFVSQRTDFRSLTPHDVVFFWQMRAGDAGGAGPKVFRISARLVLCLIDTAKVYIR